MFPFLLNTKNGQKFCCLEMSRIENNILFIRIRIGNTPCLVGRIYRVPYANMLQLESIVSQIEKACNLNLNTILMGDFNLDIKDPYKYNLIKTIELLFQFKQLISEPTRVGNKSPPQNQKVVSGRYNLM